MNLSTRRRTFYRMTEKARYSNAIKLFPTCAGWNTPSRRCSYGGE